jgi:phosphomethylpyrimidine synthase
MCGPKFCSMKISRDIRGEFGGAGRPGDAEGPAQEAAPVDAEAGMRAKAEEFAASGHRLYLPVVE